MNKQSSKNKTNQLEQYRHSKHSIFQSESLKNKGKNSQNIKNSAIGQQIVLPSIFKRIGKLEKAGSYSVNISVDDNEQVSKQNRSSFYRRNKSKYQSQHHPTEVPAHDKVKRIGKCQPLKAYKVNIEAEGEQGTLKNESVKKYLPMSYISNRNLEKDGKQNIKIKTQNTSIKNIKSDKQKPKNQQGTEHKLSKNEIKQQIQVQPQEDVQNQIKINFKLVDSSKSIQTIRETSGGQVINSTRVLDDGNQLCYQIVINTVSSTNIQDKDEQVYKIIQPKKQKTTDKKSQISGAYLKKQQTSKPIPSINRLNINQIRAKNKSLIASGNIISSSTCQLPSSLQLMANQSNPYIYDDKISSNRSQISRNGSSSLSPASKKQKPHIVYKSHPFLNSSTSTNTKKRLNSRRLSNTKDKDNKDNKDNKDDVKVKNSNTINQNKNSKIKKVPMNQAKRDKNARASMNICSNICNQLNLIKNISAGV